MEGLFSETMVGVVECLIVIIYINGSVDVLSAKIIFRDGKYQEFRLKF